MRRYTATASVTENGKISGELGVAGIFLPFNNYLFRRNYDNCSEQFTIINKDDKKLGF